MCLHPDIVLSHSIENSLKAARAVHICEYLWILFLEKLKAEFYSYDLQYLGSQKS